MMCGAGLGSSGGEPWKQPISGQRCLLDSPYLFLDFDFGRNHGGQSVSRMLVASGAMMGGMTSLSLSLYSSVSPFPSLPWSLSVPSFPHFLQPPPFLQLWRAPKAPEHSEPGQGMPQCPPLILLSPVQHWSKVNLVCLFFFNRQV